ncbi:hypothetical protein EVAR_93614_1 [Eumeta japonica]|uniref:Uncharacterized protein n=1 Tax=Eumeta variegata TaxID=151549 RepID=A0A4C1TQI4_EUMVA|nr:hypothetical protein EVAR_93614_1 [Eumeta japonica]
MPEEIPIILDCCIQISSYFVNEEQHSDTTLDASPSPFGGAYVICYENRQADNFESTPRALNFAHAQSGTPTPAAASAHDPQGRLPAAALT